MAVEDIDAEHARFATSDMTARHLRASLFVTDLDGYNIEVIQRGGRLN